MKAQIIFVVVLFYSVANGRQIPNDSNGREELIELGNVDGKTFLYDKTSRPWTEASAYCRDVGMEMATVTSDAQAQFLLLKYENGTFSGNFWVGARDAQAARALSWDNNNAEVQDLGRLRWVNVVDGVLICGIYKAATSPRLELVPCADSNFVLCQTC